MKKFLLLGIVLGLISAAPASAATNTLVPTGSVWKYLDDGSDQATNWIGPTFDDTTWLSGPGQLGYGDGDEATVVGFGPDPNNKFPTTYFRHAFVVPDASIYAVLNLRVRRDDGLVVYLNGVEVFRDNMPGGPIAFNMFSSISAGDDGNAILGTTVNPTALVTGNNVLAAEIHQQSPISSDISFDLELLGSTDQTANNPPSVAISSPGNNAFFSAPADILIVAAASDTDGGVSKVEFFEGNTKLGEDTLAPFNFQWNPVPTGNYALRAIATDNLNAKATSAVVNVTVALSTAPTIATVVPPAGNVSSLSQITVNFSEPVVGVNAADLLINGVPSTELSGSGATYTFRFAQPRGGTVLVAWEGSHSIVDFENPPKAFDQYGTGATWQYNLTDTVAPTVVHVSPAANATVQALPKVAVTFGEPVWGVDAADLRLNGVAATSVTGTGSGPYEFEFAQLPSGAVTASWTVGHGIRDFATAPNAFSAVSWTYTLNTNVVFEGQVVINEIMYHPSSERLDEEWIELRNRGSNAVNVTGWRLSRAVEFVLPNYNLAAGGYLVAAANAAAFTAKYPAVGNVVGGWSGRLSNSRDEIELEDASGNSIDRVTYADEGDWAVRTQVPSVRWEWISRPDGLGSSLELRQGALDNDTGQNWLPSTTTDGTPGVANSVASANIPPLILDVTHLPAIPRSTNLITVLARIVDESASGLLVRLWYRDATTLPAFTSTNMLDNGSNNDGTAGDGLYGVVLPPMANGSITEFYVEAVDAGSNTRTWPAAADLGGGNFAQEANAFFQVDDENYTGTQSIYRMIMRASDRNELFTPADRIQRNATFISVEGSDIQVRHRCTVRRRGASSFGANPPTMKFNFPTDTPWNGKTSMNLNSDTTYAQVIGSQVALKAGLPVADARAVQLRVNAQDAADAGTRQFGSYAHVEALDGEWARDHYPADANGNVYAKRRAGSFNCDERLIYLGPDFQSYFNCGYDKESNASENDWADLISMLFALDDTTPDNEYVQAVRRNINVDLWLRYFAVLVLMTYNETALGSVANDDYGLYRGVVDPRFMVLTHDLDTVFGIGAGGPNAIFRATETENVDRFLFHPEFQALYFDEFRGQLAGAFSTNSLYPLFDQFLSGWVPSQTIDAMKASALAQINSVIASLPPAPVVIRATLSGEPPSPTHLNSATLTVGGAGITHYRYRLNGGAFGAETPVGTPLTLSGLANGTYTVYVIGRDGSGTWQSEANATMSRSWTVLSSLRRVLINEVLARNDSAVNHSGTFPDLIELFNATTGTADLAGLRVTDDLSAPNKFIFGPGTSLAAGGYLVLYADNTNGTPGIHLGFGLDQAGETLYVLDRATNGGRIIDSVELGLQLPNLSVGRLSSGHWGLTMPTFSSANTAAATGSPTTLKINEWLATGAAPFLDDFVELYNPDALPVALGGMYFTDRPAGLPLRHRITPLTFIAGYGYRAFIADADANAGADHLNFQLSGELGEIALNAVDGTTLDCVIYGQQRAGISQGRAPNGGPRIVFLNPPTPGFGNPVPVEPVPPETIVLVPIDHTWKYDDTGTDLGTNWIATNYNDTVWPSGQGLLVAPRGGEGLPEPIRTMLMSAIGKSAMYFRTRFNYNTNLNASEVRLHHIIDDGAVFYLNGVELLRHNMPTGPIQYSTLAPLNVGYATYIGPVNVPLSALRHGENLLTVEAHNRGVDSPDIAFGLRLEAVILTNSPALAGIVFNEVLANARSVTNADGTATDWVELYNPSAITVDVAGMSLTDDPVLLPRRWVFPTGSVIAGNGYLIVRFDPNTPATTNAASVLNTGFGLSASRDEVHLLNRPQDQGSQLDAITFGLQAPDWSIGRVPNGGSNWVLTLPTAGALNIAAQLGNPRQLKVNEWMADPASGDDWFELYNPNAQPVDLGGLSFTDNLLDLFQSPLEVRSYIAGGLLGFQKFVADENPGGGADHVDFRLSRSGDLVRLSDADGNQIHQVNFGSQQTGITQGSLPDGSPNIAAFPGTATPGESNYRPIPSVVINEVLTHTDVPFEDAIELRNLSPASINIGGWYLSDARTFLTKFRIPDNTSIPAHGHIVFYEHQFNPNPGYSDSFALSSAKGDQLYLSAAVSGVLTGFRAVVEFGAAERGVSFGRFNTSVGTEFVALSTRTFGADNPDTVAQFRLGTGRTNSYPKVGPVVINEVMYHPPDIGGQDNLADEYIRLRNITSTSVQLFDPVYPTNRWHLRGAVKFDFPPNTSIPSNSTVLVVSFSPTTNAAALAAFRFTYGLTTNTAIVGPYEGKLDNSSDSLELYKPDAPQASGTPDAGFVPYVLVDRVVYADTAPWPLAADGLGSALSRVDATLFGNDPVNWIATPALSGPSDRDNDGMPDTWEELYNFNPDNPADANHDNDNDGLTNREEYLAGTDPRNPASNLDLRIAVLAPVMLEFTAAPNKSYTIEYRNDLTFGAWVPLTHIDPAPGLRTVQFPDDPSVTKRFYRLRVPRTQ